MDESSLLRRRGLQVRPLRGRAEGEVRRPRVGAGAGPPPAVGKLRQRAGRCWVAPSARLHLKVRFARWEGAVPIGFMGKLRLQEMAWEEGTEGCPLPTRCSNNNRLHSSPGAELAICSSLCQPRYY